MSQQLAEQEEDARQGTNAQLAEREQGTAMRQLKQVMIEPTPTPTPAPTPTPTPTQTPTRTPTWTPTVTPNPKN